MPVLPGTAKRGMLMTKAMDVQHLVSIVPEIFREREQVFQRDVCREELGQLHRSSEARCSAEAALPNRIGV